MKNEQIKERLHHYIETADEKKLKAIYTMVEEEIEEATDIKNSAKLQHGTKSKVRVLVPGL